MSNDSLRESADARSPHTRVLYFVRFRGPELRRRRSLADVYQAGPNKVLGLCAGIKRLGGEAVLFSDAVMNNRTFCRFPPMQESIPLEGASCLNVHYAGTWDAGVGSLLSSAVSQLRRMPDLFDRVAPDCVIVYNCHLSSLLAAWYAKFIRRLPVVLEYEDTTLLTPAARNPLLRAGLWLMEKLIRSAVDAVFSASRTLCERMKPGRGLTLEGVVRDDLLGAARKRPPHRRPGESLRLVYAGGLDASKGLSELFDALERIEHPLEVHVCGLGPMADEVRRRCETCRHPAHFHGLLERPALLEQLTSADVGVSPHLTGWTKRTVWPFKIVEYLAACGCVVCSRTGPAQPELEGHLHIYEGQQAEAIAEKLREVIDAWPRERDLAPRRMAWAAERYHSRSAARRVLGLLPE